MDRTQYISIKKSLDLEKKPLAIAVHAAQDLFLAVSALALWNFGHDTWMRFAMIPMLFCLMFRGFGIMHDAVHGAVSKTRWINDLAGDIGGAFCMLPFENWKRSHLKHHQWSGNVEKDPVMAVIIAFPKYSKLKQNLISSLWMLWFPILGLIQHFIFWDLSLRLYVKEPRSLKMGISILMPLAVWGLLLFATPASFVMSVLLPTVFVYFVAVEVVNFPHHLQLPQFRGEEKFPAWEQFQTARSCVYPKWFARFVVLNFNFHIEHHMFPDVPWYHLDKLHEPVKNALQGRYNTDPSLGWILKNKRVDVGTVLSPADTHEPSEVTAA
ncbi:fatty acid desaturase family protein [Bdellovibrio sp. HCB337]|uniref:fatty acid desaturase family protein n=1 Tax=Bdellovibrio sp. HCB337 TaxID=3394358 RepID=UPI0039A44368